MSEVKRGRPKKSESERSEPITQEQAVEIVTAVKGKETKYRTDKLVLDACCGSRMFWFDKENADTVYMDCRELDTELCDGRRLVVSPDVMGDFRDMPFEDGKFRLVVFDPPHFVRLGETSWTAKKYGVLKETWPQDIKQGFSECMRVLEPNGVLVFKWNEEQIKLSEILKLIPYNPLFGDKRSKTHWLVFMKREVTA